MIPTMGMMITASLTCPDVSNFWEDRNNFLVVGCVLPDQYSKEHKYLGLCALLDALDSELDRNGGMQSLLLSVSPEAKNDLIECLGYAYRPRRHEVAMALARMRGISFNEIPSANDGIEAEATRKSEERKKALANLWATRRRARKEEECQKLV